MHKRFTPWIRSNPSVYSILLLSSKGPQISLAWKPSHGLRQPYSPRSCLGTFPIFQVPISQVYPSYSPIPSEIINVWFPRANYPIFLSENRYFIISLSLLKKNALLVSHFPLSTSQDFVPNFPSESSQFSSGSCNRPQECAGSGPGPAHYSPAGWTQVSFWSQGSSSCYTTGLDRSQLAEL